MTTTFNNLREMLGHYGSNTPYSFGRAFYKYTPCGPWTAFVVEVEPAHVETTEATVTEQVEPAPTFKRSLVARAVDGSELPVRTVQFLGLEREDPAADNLPDYIVMLDNYVRRQNAHHRDVRVQFSTGTDAVGVTLTTPVPQKTRDVYYEDGDASDPHAPWIDRCVGVKIGSIVEGSDVEVGPFVLAFPFDSDQLDKVVCDVNNEADFYWRRDNSIHGTVTRIRGDQADKAYLTWEEFSDLPELEVIDGEIDPADLPQDVLDWILNHCQQEEDQKNFPAHGISVSLFCDDSVY